jgi:hypothetical protein
MRLVGLAGHRHQCHHSESDRHSRLAAAAMSLKVEGIIVHNLLADVGQSRSEPDRCEASAHRLIELAGQIGSKRFEAHALQHQAEVLRLRGQRADAENMLEESLAIARESGLQFVGPWIMAGCVANVPSMMAVAIIGFRVEPENFDVQRPSFRQVCDPFMRAMVSRL